MSTGKATRANNDAVQRNHAIPDVLIIPLGGNALPAGSPHVPVAEHGSDSANTSARSAPTDAGGPVASSLPHSTSSVAPVTDFNSSLYVKKATHTARRNCCSSSQPTVAAPMYAPADRSVLRHNRAIQTALAGVRAVPGSGGQLSGYRQHLASSSIATVASSTPGVTTPRLCSARCSARYSAR